MLERSLMAIGAHADDIELCAGGSLMKYRDHGYNVVYIMATNNFSGSWCIPKTDGTIDYTSPPHHVIEPQRKKEAQGAAQMLGTTAIHLDHPQRHYVDDQGQWQEVRFGCALPKGIQTDVPTILTACEDKAAVSQLAEHIARHNPEAILTHSPVSTNPEHYATSLLVLNAYKQAVKQGHEGMLLMWHDPATGQFGDTSTRWDTYIDVSLHWDKKFQLIAQHACQIPNPSVLELPPRGPACNCQHAEVFNIVSVGKPYEYGSPFTLEILAHRK